MVRIMYNPNTIITDIRPFQIRELSSILNDNNAWRSLAEEFNIRFSIFNQQDIISIQRDPDPSWKFLQYVARRCCTVGLFCQILRSMEMYDALAILVEPEHAVIIQQPGDDHETKYVYGSTQLQLECRATGLPPPSFTWFRGNKELSNQRSSTLVIDEFREEDEGEYHCCVYQLIENDPIMLHSNIVNVQLHPIPPAIIQHPVAELECRIGDSFSLTCFTSGHPAPQYEWYKGNEKIPGADTHILNIPDVDLSHRAHYRCYVYNTVGAVWTNSCNLSVVLQGIFPGLEGPQRLKAKEKIALLIGNDTYCHLSQLKTPRNDVMTVANILKDVGFRVMAFHNLTLHEMRKAVETFCSLLPEDSYAIFFFFGHGFEIQDKFMLPIDAPPAESYLRRDSLCEKEVIKAILSRKTRLLFMSLDMCLKAPDRNENPHIYQELPETYVFEPLRNLVIQYSTTSNLSAYEKVKGHNSNYVNQLKKHLGKDLPINKILDIVKSELAGDKQMPFNCSNVVDEIYLTDEVIEDKTTKKKFEQLMTLPCVNGPLLFEKTGLRAAVIVRPYKGCFLNSLDVMSTGLMSWKLEIELVMKPLPKGSNRTVDPAGTCNLPYPVLRKNHGLDCCQEESALVITVHNLQRVKIPVHMTLWLRDLQTNELVDSAFLDLEEPLIAKQRWWYKPQDDAEEK